MMATRTRAPVTPSAWGPGHDAALLEGLAALGLAATSVQSGQLFSYARLLLKWNRVYNLLGTGDADALLADHLLDSAAVVPVLASCLRPPGAHLLDIGSGAGLPGIPIAIMLPALPVTLIEPVGKKAAFLRQVVAQCGLAHVSVREARFEALAANGENPFDSFASRSVTPHFICRAFTALAEFARLCAPVAAPGSLILAMKAARVDEELAQLAATGPDVDVLAVEKLSIPGRPVQRNLVVMGPKPHARDRGITRPGPGPDLPREI